MSQAQILPRQRSCNGLWLPQQIFPQPQPGFDFNSQASETSDQFCSSVYRHPMAQAMLQHQYGHVNYMPPQVWTSQQTLSQESMPLVAAPRNSASGNGSCSQEQFWEGTPAFDNGPLWGGVLPPKAMIISDPQYQYLQNSGLAYNDMAAQNITGKSGIPNDGRLSWLAIRPNGVPRGVSVNGSELETHNSCSPKSHFDESLASESLSPGSMPDQASTSGHWNGYSTSFAPGKESSPRSTSAGLHPVPVPTRTVEDVRDFDFSGHPMTGLGITMPSMEPAGSSYQNDLTGSMDDTHQTASDYSHSHGSTPGTSPWCLTAYSRDFSGLPYMQRDRQMNSVRDDVSAGESPSQRNGYTPQMYPWRESRIGARAQVKLQDRFQVRRSVDVQTQRRHNDEILVEGKKAGLTYKEIRKKMLGEKPAESTLRGRYRSLTKARQDRVRKPVWRTRDLELLNVCVEREFDRIDATLAHPQALSLDQRLVKVQWKRVADYIDEHGGSYHFGNATCKRKWLEVNKGP